MRKTETERWRILGPGGGGAQFIPAFSPHNPDILLTACDMTGAYISRNGGRSWRQFNLKGVANAFAFDPVCPDTLYAGSSGLFRSEDGGEGWQLIFPSPLLPPGEKIMGDHGDHRYILPDGKAMGLIRGIACRLSHPSCLGLALDDEENGGFVLYGSADRGVSFGLFCAVPGRIFFGLSYAPVFSEEEDSLIALTDKGVFAYSFTSCVLRALPEPADTRLFLHLSLRPSGRGGVVFYALTESRMGDLSHHCLWRTENYGVSWEALKPFSDVSPPGLGWDAFTLLAPSLDGDGILYAGVAAHDELLTDSGSGSVRRFFGVIKSPDDGASWKWVYRSDYGEDPDNADTGWAERDYGLSWLDIGPKGVGPLGLAVCPGDSRRCCFSDLSSSFLTQDGGQTWKQIYTTAHSDGSWSTRGLDVTTCYGVHFDPFSREHLAVSYTDIGLFHSHNGGRTWLHAMDGVPEKWGNTCYWLEFDPEVEGRVWSAWGYSHDLPRPKMMRGELFYYREGGVLQTDDGLAAWKKANRGLPSNSVATHILLDPKSPVQSRTLYLCVFDKGVYKSVDGGRSWFRSSSGIRDNLNVWRLCLACDGVLYLIAARGVRNGQTLDGSLYRSFDGGEKWERLPLPKGVNGPNDIISHPVSPSRLYLSCWPGEENENPSGGGLYESRDGGVSWERVFHEAQHVYAACFDPNNPERLWLVTFGSGAFVSDNGGRGWTPLTGYDFKWGHRPVPDPVRRDKLYITTFGSSLWHGPAGGGLPPEAPAVNG